MGPPDRGSMAMPPAGLIGEQKPSSGANEEDSQRNFMNAIRQFHADLDVWAGTFPSFAKYARKAKDALTEGVNQVLREMKTPNASGQPPIVG